MDWEYQVTAGAVRLASDVEAVKRMLDDMGSRGWELVYVLRGAEIIYYFKRPIRRSVEGD